MSRSETLTSTDPCTGVVVWQGPVGDVPAAVARARAAAAGWAATPLESRVAIARAYAARVLAESEAFATLIARETGKPLWETRTEVASTMAKVEISLRARAERTGTIIADAGDVRSVTRHKPHGVLAVLGPYNFPAHLPNGHIVPALIAGNAVVFKPSEKTPAVGAFMARLWAEAGLPDDVLTVVQGGADTGKALAAADIDGLLFTGSSAAGAALARQFAETPGRILALEMGGNNPLIVWDAEDLEAAAALVVHSAYLSAGQRCTNTRRLIVSQRQSGPLIDIIVSLIDRLSVGSQFENPPVFMGPVIDNRAASVLKRAETGLKAAGSVPIRSLERPLRTRPWLRPALHDVTDVPNRPDQELFGPLLQLIRVPSFEAAMAEANATKFGLAAGLIGGDEALYRRFWAESRAGVVNWNRPTNGAASSAPFGGVGASGNHRPSAFYAADYAAFPVASLEADSPAAPSLIGLRP
ncbi:succinylglutamate-semialdehyde dehydrogenase [Polymorphobacter sp.]|uniref:succinylglutamate-semialdehyde dehydrogenase n=1 Tax=Polymorphobacter sp. TaxID=1909290 RepID=UPI003F7082CD